MLLCDIMSQHAMRIGVNATMHEAADLLRHSRASDLMVVDDEGAFVGVLVLEPPITLRASDEALKAACTMISRQMRRLPVVEHDKLVGTVSRADICRAVSRRR